MKGSKLLLFTAAVLCSAAILPSAEPSNIAIPITNDSWCSRRGQLCPKIRRVADSFSALMTRDNEGAIQSEQDSEVIRRSNLPEGILWIAKRALDRLTTTLSLIKDDSAQSYYDGLDINHEPDAKADDSRITRHWCLWKFSECWNWKRKFFENMRGSFFSAKTDGTPAVPKRDIKDEFDTRTWKACNWNRRACWKAKRASDVMLEILNDDKDATEDTIPAISKQNIGDKLDTRAWKACNWNRRGCWKSKRAKDGIDSATLNVDDLFPSDEANALGNQDLELIRVSARGVLEAMT